MKTDLASKKLYQSLSESLQKKIDDIVKDGKIHNIAYPDNECLRVMYWDNDGIMKAKLIQL